MLPRKAWTGRSRHYINGEYWGLLGIRDRHDQFHFAYHYNLDPDNIIIHGSHGDQTVIYTLVDFINEQDLSVDENYDAVKQMLDIRSFTDHLVVNLYSHNSHYEVGYWRAATPADDHFGDGRWRVLIQDFDATLRLPVTGVFPDALGLPGHRNRSPIFRNLLDSEAFRIYFINRFADHINTTFVPSRFQAIVNETRNEVLSYLAEDHHRSKRSLFTAGQRTALINWSNDQPARQREQIRNFFDLSHDILIALDTIGP